MRKKLLEVCTILTHPKRVAPTAFQLVFCKNAASKLHPAFVNYSIIRCTPVRSHLNGNLLMLRLSTRKIVKNQPKIIDLFLCFPSSEKFCNVACVSDFMIMSNILSPNFNMASSDNVHVSLNSYLFFILSDNLSTRTPKQTSFSLV